MWKHINKSKLSFIGHNGSGKQIRDVLFVEDLCALILKQIMKDDIITNNMIQTISIIKKVNVELLKLDLIINPTKCAWLTVGKKNNIR